MTQGSPPKAFAGARGAALLVLLCSVGRGASLPLAQEPVPEPPVGADHPPQDETDEDAAQADASDGVAEDGDADTPPADAEEVEELEELEVADGPDPQELAEVPAAVDDAQSSPVHGYLRTRYLGRGTSGEYDHDLFNALTVNVGDPTRDPWSAHLHAYLAIDLDGETEDAFFSIADTYDDGIDARLYQAYVDANQIPGLERARFGRQQVFEVPVLVWFDGLGVETEPRTDLDLSAGAYGGVPVRIFESSADGDSVLGAYVASRPWARANVRLDFVRFSDESELGDEDNDLWYVHGTQGVGDRVTLGGAYSYLDDDPRDWRASVTGYDPERDLMIRASYYELLETQDHLALELDPLFGALLELFPYEQAGLLASKGITDWLLLEGGVDVRNVSDEDDEGEFNRDFSRYYVNVGLLDLTSHEIDLTITGDSYDSDRSDVRTWGADVSWDATERLETAVGSYYSLYKYDLFLNEERDDVRTYYVRLDYEQTRNLSFDLDYEFEDEDLDDYHTVKVGVSWRF